MLARSPHTVPLVLRTPTQRLTHAREDHARCLTLAADYRVRMSRGERGLRERHDWALRHCRVLRYLFPNLFEVQPRS